MDPCECKSGSGLSQKIVYLRTNSNFLGSKTAKYFPGQKLVFRMFFFVSLQCTDGSLNVNPDPDPKKIGNLRKILIFWDPKLQGISS